MSESSPPTPSQIPQPPTSSMSYIVVVVLLLGAIGGLLVWKLRDPAHSPPLPSPTGLGTATITAPPPTFIEPPPPPPPIEQASATSDSTATKSPASAGTALNQCSAPTCSGTAPPQLQSALAQRAGAARACYERALRINSALQGKIMVQVRVDNGGNVCSATVVQDDIHSNEVASCLTRSFRSAKLPPAAGGCVDVKVPLSFVPQQGK